MRTLKLKYMRAVLKTKGTVFPYTDRPRQVNNIFIFSQHLRVCRSILKGCQNARIKVSLSQMAGNRGANVIINT